MRLLALQPYDTASHRALLEGWRSHSRHTFDVLTLPGRHFKWRMRQAPVCFADQIGSLSGDGWEWDALWCTSMLDLAALRGLCPAAAALPTAVYFHENQLTYPARHTRPRDLHFGLTNMTTALAAAASHPSHKGDAPPQCVWWNSAYNRDSFLTALAGLLSRMPDHPPKQAVETIRHHSAVHYPGIDLIDHTPRTPSMPPRLLWAARWEYDKGPERFFHALDELSRRGRAFHLNVIGEQFAKHPGCFDSARERFAQHIVRWGYQPDRASYTDALSESDIVVSTAEHEFFGLAVAEAVSAGCIPVLPDALAYPEIWSELAVYHDQTPAGVADAIERAITLNKPTGIERAANRFAWPEVAKRLDDAIDTLASTC